MSNESYEMHVECGVAATKLLHEGLPLTACLVCLLIDTLSVLPICSRYASRVRILGEESVCKIQQYFYVVGNTGQGI